MNELERDYEEDQRYYDLWDAYDVCPKCDMHSIFKGQDSCDECRKEEEDLELLEYSETKGQRREARRSRGRYGMVKHLEPNVRPASFPKVKVRFS